MLEVLFQYGPLTFRSFDLLLAVGFIFSLFFLIKYVLRKKMNLSFLADSLFLLIISGLILGRLFYFMEHANALSKHWFRVFFIWDLQFSPAGILYGTLGTLFWRCRQYKEDFWAWLDAIVLSGLILLFFVSLGNFMEGSNYGLPTTLPWGIAFNNISIPFAVPIHPTQLYAAVAIFSIFSYLIHYAKR
ncbi:MAG: prolipoprotein diacylglyceryl transferase, partial [bacterium]|nr:prolipoprotein diacylglyceryl transferase [bacterium]